MFKPETEILLLSPQSKTSKLNETGEVQGANKQFEVLQMQEGLQYQELYNVIQLESPKWARVAAN